MDILIIMLLWSVMTIAIVCIYKYKSDQFSASYWQKRARESDLAILWPVMKREAQSLEHARKAMFMHMAMDPAYRDMTDVEFEEIKARLT